LYANPAEGERYYYLRVLLNHVRGPTSFDSPCIVHNVLHSTFREACEVLGLVETDSSLDDALTEALAFKMPCTLRRMFAIIIVFCECTNTRALWDKHFEDMADDYVRNHGNTPIVVQLVLRDIADIVRSMGKDIKNYGLPELDVSGANY